MTAPAISIDEHPVLRVATFVTRFPVPVGDMQSPSSLRALLAPEPPAGSGPGAVPLTRDEEVRTAVRDMLRHGGYKPTGRGKPASEYLVRAASEGALGSINVAVDACNVVSLHSGFPISVVDLARAHPPFRISIAPAGAEYIFNASGQTIDLSGLVCLFDAEGPCANAVRDAQRTKTNPDTRETLSVVWGVAGYEDRLERAVEWYRELLEEVGAVTE